MSRMNSGDQLELLVRNIETAEREILNNAISSATTAGRLRAELDSLSAAAVPGISAGEDAQLGHISVDLIRSTAGSRLARLAATTVTQLEDIERTVDERTAVAALTVARAEVDIATAKAHLAQAQAGIDSQSHLATTARSQRIETTFAVASARFEACSKASRMALLEVETLGARTKSLLKLRNGIEARVAIGLDGLEDSAETAFHSGYGERLMEIALAKRKAEESNARRVRRRSWAKPVRRFLVAALSLIALTAAGVGIAMAVSPSLLDSSAASGGAKQTNQTVRQGG